MSMMLGKVAKKLCRLVRNVFVKPIPVFCFHQVSDEYDSLTTWECDWTQTDVFMRNINVLKRKYTFISLPEVTNHLQHDCFRFKRYAALTADDGYRSLLNVIPWFEEQRIPITLFLNTKYLDKKSWSAINEEQANRAKPDVDMLMEVCPKLYLSKEELFSLNSPFISIGMHGHEHLDATCQTNEEFRENIQRCMDIIYKHPRYIRYFAFTWGHHNVDTDMVVRDMHLIPVTINGGKNCNKADSIDRICIDGIRF